MKVFYLAGDLGVNLLVGALVGVVCAVVFGPRWPMWAAMAAGMILGMLLAFGLSSIAGIWFGAFEVQVPSMLTGMIAGMAVSMRSVHEPMRIAQAAVWGCACGAASIGFTWTMNVILRGERRYGR